MKIYIEIETANSTVIHKVTLEATVEDYDEAEKVAYNVANALGFTKKEIKVAINKITAIKSN